MTSLQLANKARALTLANPPAILYKHICREIPRVLQIYDIMNMAVPDVKKKIRSYFYENATVRDSRVIEMLVIRGYIDLEDTMLQHKTLQHLMAIIEGRLGTDQNVKQLNDPSDEEQFARWVGP